MVSISDIAYNYPLNVIMKHNTTKIKICGDEGFQISRDVSKTE